MKKRSNPNSPRLPANQSPIPISGPAPSKFSSATLIFWLFLASLLTPLVYSSHTFFGFISERTWFFSAVVECMVLAAIFTPGFLSAKLSRLQIALLIFLAVLFIADGFGVDPVQSYFSGYAHMEGFLIYLHAGLYFFVLTRIPLSKARWHTALLVSTGMAAFVVLKGYFSDGGWQPVDHRLIATIGNPSYLAAYLLIHVFIAGYLLTQFAGKYKRLKQGLAGGALVCLLGGIYLTSTRSAVIGLAAGAFYLTMFYIWRRYRTLTGIAIGLVSISVLFLVLFRVAQTSDFLQKIPAVYRLTHFSGNNNTLRPRYVCWKIALDGIVERPLLGWGQENFSYGFARHYDPAILAGSDFEWYDRAHNSLLDWTFSAGVAGLLAYLFIWYCLITRLRATNTRLRVSEKGLLAAAFVAYFIFNLLNFDSLVTLQTFVLLLALIDAPAGTTPASPPKPAWVRPVQAATAVLVVCLANFSVREPYQTLRQLDREQKLGDVQQQILALEQIYQRASVRKPDLADCLESLTLNVLRTNLPAETKQFCYRKTTAVLDEQLAQHPAYTRLMARAAALFVAGGDTDRAIALCQQIITIEGGRRPSAYLQLGNAYLTQKALPKAMATFDQAHRLYPSSNEPLLYKALIYAAQRDTTQCFAILRTINTETLVNKLGFVKAIYGQAGDPHQFVVRLMQAEGKEIFTPPVFVEWALAAFDAHDTVQMTTAMNSFYNYYFRNRFDYGLMQQLIDDGKRGIRPDRLTTIARDMAW